jgi:hypothetical protein
MLVHLGEATLGTCLGVGLSELRVTGNGKSPMTNLPYGKNDARYSARLMEVDPSMAGNSRGAMQGSLEA